MSRAQIDKFYADHIDLEKFLLGQGEMSFAVESGNNFRRSFILAIASYFEHEVCDIIRQVPARHAAGNILLSSLIELKVIRRQYHTYFDWDAPSAAGFFALFGTDCKEKFQKKLRTDEDFKTSVQAFLRLGRTRNQLVHKNFVQFDVDQSPADINDQFILALKFIDYISKTLLLEIEADNSTALKQKSELGPK